MTDLIGKTFGEYQLIELIQEYEHTLLIKAYQPGKDRYVSIIFLKPHAANNAEFLQQFINAAKIAAQIQNINILPVEDYGQREGMTYSVSPFMEMGTVRANLGWFYDLQNAHLLISQITDGLEYLYARGQIHGNLQSTNVYLDAARHPYLSGFGISQPPGSAQNPYFSPEQIEGGVVDQRTDVYALGVLLYELLTGVTPPVGIVAKPSAIRPDIPEAIDRIVLKALAQNPAQRFQSPAELRNTLQNSVLPMHTEPVSTPAPAPGVSQSVNVQQPTKSTNWTAIILVVLLVALLIGAAFLIIPPLLQDDEVVEVIPTQLPVEQPTEPPAEPPTEMPTEPPDVEPTEPDAGFPPEDLPDFCNSIGFAAGIAAFGIAFTYKKRKRDI